MEVLLTLAYIFIVTGSLGSIANVIQMILNCRNERKKKTVFSISLFSLNTADVLASISFVCRGIALFMKVYMEDNSFSFPDVWRALNSAVAFSLISSFAHVVFIALQRAIAVTFPLRVKQIITRSRCYVILIIIWVISISSALCVYFYISISFVMPHLAVITGISLIIVYSVICYQTTRQRIVNHGTSSDVQRRRQQLDREVLLYSVAIHIVFIICNFPMAVHIFLGYPVIHSYAYAAHTLYSLNPLLDTLLYFAWSYHKRRRAGVSDQSFSAQRMESQSSNGLEVESTHL